MISMVLIQRLSYNKSYKWLAFAEMIGNIRKGVKEATLVITGASTAEAEDYDMANQAGQVLEQNMKDLLRITN